MDRRVTRRLALAAGLGLAAALLLTCSNPINLLATLETEVKVANNKFLKVMSVTPALNDIDVNPGLSLTIVFDRALDESTIADGILAISPIGSISGYDYTYTSATKTLAIHALPYLADQTAYAATLTSNLRGADGSELQNEYVWGFTTGTYPAGSVHINNDALATNLTGVTLNMVYNSAVDEFRYSLVSENDLLTNPANVWQVKTPSQPGTLTAPDGVKTAWVQFKKNGTPDVLSVVQADEILYDTTPPAATSFAINKGAAYVSSTAVTLYNDISDLTPLQMRFQNGMAAGGSWEDYESTKAWTLADTIGTRAVTAEFMDSAGNSTTVARDYILYGTPVVTGASLGSASVGTVTVSFSGGTEDTGTDVFYVYSRDYPSGARYTEQGSGTSSVSVNVPVTQGYLYYFHVRIYSAAAGGYSAYSSTYALGYTANIAIIYDSGDTTDTQTATDLKTILTTDLPNHATYGPYIDGTMPVWSVVLIPQSLVSTTYSPSNVFYGDPVVITSGTDLYANANQTRNVIHHGRGVVAMGYGGTRLLDTCETNWSTWGYVTTAPTEIGFGESWTSAASAYMYTWTTGNTVWNSPLTSTVFPGGVTPTHDAATQISYANLTAYSAYIPSYTVTDGQILGQEDNANATHFSVVRQGRFLQYGYVQETDRPYTGWVYIINLMALMDNY